MHYQEILALMPITAVHNSEGRTHIAAAIESHGGMAVVSQRLDLKNRPRAKELFKDWAPFRRELLSLMKKHSGRAAVFWPGREPARVANYDDVLP